MNKRQKDLATFFLISEAFRTPQTPEFEYFVNDLLETKPKPPKPQKHHFKKWIKVGNTACFYQKVEGLKSTFLKGKIIAVRPDRYFTVRLNDTNEIVRVRLSDRVDDERYRSNKGFCYPPYSAYQWI